MQQSSLDLNHQSHAFIDDRYIDQFERYWTQFADTVNAQCHIRKTTSSPHFSRLNSSDCLAISECLSSIYQQLLKAYTEPHRAYHTVQHIVECLDLFHQIKHLLIDSFAVELAIWFHDFIYQAQANDNELQSAIHMQKLCQTLNPIISLEKVHDWIIATQQHQASTDSDLQYLLDIDLAILGSPATRFAEYQQQIRFEYSWVDADVYQRKRTAVLQHFYDLQPIYRTQIIQTQLEQQARVNLNQAIHGTV